MGALLAGLLLLAGCSDDDGSSDGDPTEAPTTAAWEPTPGLCQVLTAAERAELLGLADPDRLEGPQRMEGQGCAWVDGKNPAVQLILVAIPTTTWIKDMPAAIDAQLADPNLSADNRADLEALEAELATLSSDETDDLCDLFGRLAEVQGYPEDSSTTVYVTRSGPGLSAQHCEGDTYTSLVGRSTKVTDSEPMLAAYQAAVEKAAAAR